MLGAQATHRNENGFVTFANICTLDSILFESIDWTWIELGLLLFEIVWSIFGEK